jgi:hypothetical protein
VEVAYVGDASQAFGSTSGAPNPSAFFTNYSLKQKANEGIREDYCRWFFTRERNCEGESYAERYAQSYLFKHLKDLYTGELVITGEPALKPYDQVFLYDSYNDMAGPFEVEQVTHVFSPETGFVTAIVPDLGEGAFLPNRGNEKLIPLFYPYSLVIYSFSKARGCYLSEANAPDFLYV